MIRVLYRWDAVQPGSETTFVELWSKLTRAIRAQTPGALGSLLLKTTSDPVRFVALARWTSLDLWTKRLEQAVEPEAVAALHEIHPNLTVKETFDERADLTTGADHMTRVLYRWRVKPGTEKLVEPAWSQLVREVRQNVEGSFGALLLRSLQDPHEFVAVSRWRSREEWLQRSASFDSQASELLSASRVGAISSEVLDEVEDLTV